VTTAFICSTERLSLTKVYELACSDMAGVAALQRSE
jgi:hypothetical protein